MTGNFSITGLILYGTQPVYMTMHAKHAAYSLHTALVSDALTAWLIFPVNEASQSNGTIKLLGKLCRFSPFFPYTFTAEL